MLVFLFSLLFEIMYLPFKTPFRVEMLPLAEIKNESDWSKLPGVCSRVAGVRWW